MSVNSGAACLKLLGPAAAKRDGRLPVVKPASLHCVRPGGSEVSCPNVQPRAHARLTTYWFDKTGGAPARSQREARCAAST